MAKDVKHLGINFSLDFHKSVCISHSLLLSLAGNHDLHVN